MKTWIVRTGVGVAAAATALLTTGAAAFADPAPTSDAGPMIGPACPVGKLCVFDGPQFTGHRVDLFQCGVYDVRSDGLGRVGSYVNNQTGDQVATFSGPDENGAIVPQYTSTAVDANQDATDRTTWVVQPC